MPRIAVSGHHVPSKMTPDVIAVFALALACLTAAPAAQSPQQQPPQQPPTFQATTQAVQLDVRVYYDGGARDGQFVDDLTLDDFEILEGGTPQRLRALFFVSPAERDRATAPPLVTLRGSAGTTPASASTPGGAAAVTARQTWIFVFDLNHLTPGGGFDRARTAVQDFIRDQFRDGDMAGVVAGSRMVNNRLTSVRQELIDAVGSVRAVSDRRSRMIELTREWPRLRDEAEALAVANNDRDALQRAVARACADDPSACQATPPDLMLMDKARRLRSDIQRATSNSLSSMTALANGLARIPGPKTVVLLSDGFVVQELESTLRSTVGQATRAGARIYAIDVRGLNRGSNADIAERMSADDPAGGPARFDLGEDGPNSLAVDTGGLMIRNENNIGRALSTVAADANRYYVIGYEPANLTLDGQFRPIEVTVKRPGVVVRARRGYLALPSAQLLVPQVIK
jgi:VWFA-related protein